MNEEHIHLKLIQKISNLINQSNSFDKTLKKITSIIAKSLHFEVVSIYLWDSLKKELKLKATKGLITSSKKPIILKANEGLTGVVFHSRSTLTATPASKHPNYKYFPESGEKAFESFIGAPITIGDSALGVLTGQTSIKHSITAAEETFFDIIASRLAGIIEIANKLSNIKEDHNFHSNILAHQGKGLSKGVTIGPAFILKQKTYTPSVISKTSNEKKELSKIDHTFNKTTKEIQEFIDTLSSSTLAINEINIFKAHLMILIQSSLKAEIKKLIQKEKLNAISAIHKKIEQIRNKFEKSKDKYFADKALDFIDIGDKLQENLSSGKLYSKHRKQPNKGDILVAKNITPSELIELHKKKIGGIITESGGETSHTSILANSLGIPAITGISDISSKILTNDKLLMDGRTGFVFINPDNSLIKEFKHLTDKQNQLKKIIIKEANDKRKIKIPAMITANVGFPSDISIAKDYQIKRAGLVRTEFAFMQHKKWPDIKTQVAIYNNIATQFTKSITIRTLDIGADKTLSYHKLKKETNPLLGLRSIRFSMENIHYFESQLKAILLSHKKNKIFKILLPMISNIWEIETARNILTRLSKEENISPKDAPQLGIMVEVPSIIYQLEDFQHLIDFISIGTNDLTQYLLAVDRDSDTVRHLYSSLHPAVIRALYNILKIAKRIKKPVSVCGEFASTPKGALTLLSLGFTNLSILPSKSPVIKHLLKNLNRTVLHKIKHSILNQKKESDIQNFLHQQLEKIDPLLIELQ